LQTHPTVGDGAFVRVEEPDIRQLRPNDVEVLLEPLDEHAAVTLRIPVELERWAMLA
jgi:hypothetical protein